MKKAVSPEGIALDQRDPSPEARGPKRGDEAGGTTAQHHEVVGALGSWVDPVGGPHRGNQALVVGVFWKHGPCGREVR